MNAIYCRYHTVLCGSPCILQNQDNYNTIFYQLQLNKCRLSSSTTTKKLKDQKQRQFGDKSVCNPGVSEINFVKVQDATSYSTGFINNIIQSDIHSIEFIENIL